MGQVGRAADGHVAGAVDDAERHFRGLAGGNFGCLLRHVRRGIHRARRETRCRRHRPPGRLEAGASWARRRAAVPMRPLGAAALRDRRARRRESVGHNERRDAASPDAGARRRFRLSPSGAPWVFSEPCKFGAPLPISGAAGDQRRLVRARAPSSMAAATASMSWPSTLLDVPAGGAKARRLVHRRREGGRAVDGNTVVVPEHDQPGELQMPGEVDRLVADALLQAAVAGDDIGVVVDKVRRRNGRPACARRAPCRRRSRGPGRAARWWSRCRSRGRIPDGRQCGAELAEALQLLDRHVLIADQIVHRI